MKTLLLCALLSAALVSLGASAWLVCALALARRRGRQVARMIARREAGLRRIRPIGRKLPVDFGSDHRLVWTPILRTHNPVTRKP